MSEYSETALKLLILAEDFDQAGHYEIADLLEGEAYRFAQTSRLQNALGNVPGSEVFTDDKEGALTAWGTHTGYNTEPYQRTYGPSLEQVEQSGAQPNPYEDGKPIANLVREQQQWMRGGNPYYGPMQQADAAMQSMYTRMLRKLAYYDAYEARGGVIPPGAREAAKSEYENYVARLGKNYNQGVAANSGTLGSGAPASTGSTTTDDYLRSIGVPR